jgi:hypothetical protein
VNEHEPIEEAVFCVGSHRGYVTRTQAAGIRIETTFGVGSFSRELRILARKELGCAKKTVLKPLPGND